jgi:hypothetical protein
MLKSQVTRCKMAAGLFLFLLVYLPGLCVDSPGKKVQEFDLTGEKQWLDTAMDLKPGDQLKFSATGKMHYIGTGEFGPEGLPRSWMDLLRILPLNDANRGALIGRIGSSDASRPFLIGAGRENRVSNGGRLFLGLNQKASEKATGSFHVAVEVKQAASTASVPALDLTKLPKPTQNMLDQIPTRVQDAQGVPGDRVNFLIVGTEAQVKQALQEAGWVQVNRSIKDALIQSALATFSRQAYTRLPMSELLLFDRPQDFGYAQADPLVVVAARHHFRLWKAPFLVDGQTLWAGAGTHDIGFDKDQRNGSITHKIDPDTDKERDYIGESLKETGRVATTLVLTPSEPVTEAKTAHGESFYSDGRTLVVILNPDSSDQSLAFGNLFCTVLSQNNPDGGEWGSCSQYLEVPGEKTVPLEPIPTKYRVLIVPGLMNTCFAGAPPYKEGQAYLKEKYGLTVEMLPLPNNSCEDNAREIAAYLSGKLKEDSRRYIVFGYSKGTPDFQVALAKEPEVAAAVAAFISVAGASGGSPVADTIPGQADRWIRQYSLPNCKGDLSQGFKSLSQTARRAFLSSHPHPIVPTYSVAAVSNLTNTSKMLLQTWQILSAFDPKNDSQVIKDDAIVPESTYLGSALADHFAIALPFETSNESVKSGADKNHYPRSALLEAMIRFVIQDLGSPK